MANGDRGDEAADGTSGLAALIAAMDWSATGLGRRAGWSAALRAIVVTGLGSRLSHTLQRSLLPPALPHPANGELVARYRASTAATEVGGDWYDALILPDGRLMVTIGDVAGHDVAAAVTMGQIRLLLRSRADESVSPAQLCATVNRLLPTVGSTTLATMIVAFIDLCTGRATFVNAGHPRPVLSADGQAYLVPVPMSLPLGVTLDAGYQEAETTLPAGATLLLYTDGLIERRHEPLSVSRDRLIRRIADLDATGLDAAVDALVDASAVDAVDDIAVLAFRRPP